MMQFQITPQPDAVSCGPSSLHAVYRHLGDAMPLAELTREISSLPEGGTLAVWLGLHALRRGYEVTIHTWDLRTFDPTWFEPGAPPMRERLMAQLHIKGRNAKLAAGTTAYMEFLDAGGSLRMEDITPALLHDLVSRGGPLIAGLSATWLYRCARERADERLGEFTTDDTAGYPAGHFVVVHGVDLDAETADIADPYLQQPYPGKHYYRVNIHRLIGAILLGIVTFDAKLLIIRPKNKEHEEPPGGE